MFKNIKTFDWKDLSGRTVEIQENTSVDGTIIIAKDIKTNEMFLVQANIIEEN